MPGSRAARVAVRSAPLRSKGRLPQPRQKVGQPPSEFWRPASQPSPATAARSIRAAVTGESDGHFRIAAKATSAPGVSSASGTAPLRSVHPHPPVRRTRVGMDLSVLTAENPIGKAGQTRWFD